MTSAAHVDATERERLLAIVEQFAQSQWWPAERLRDAQLKAATALLRHARRHAPFYRDLIPELPVGPQQALDEAQWQALPVLTREDLQNCFPRFRCPPLFPEDRTYTIHSSGSTGKPVKVVRNTLNLLHNHACLLRDHAWHERDSRQPLAAIRWLPDGKGLYPQGEAMPDWGAPVNWLYESGPSCALAVTSTTTQQLQWLQGRQPAYLVIFPSLLAELLAESRARDWVPSSLREILTLGEQLDPAVRNQCQAQWGVPVHDVYSAQEIGCIALQCPQNEHYHVQGETVLLEILDENDRPLPPGQVGKIVVTGLASHSMPLLRYAIGDYGSLGPSCACGRGLPVLQRILGRTRNLLLLPDGGKVWPRLGELRYGEILPIRQFRLLQTGPTTLELLLVAPRRGTLEEERRLQELITTRIGYPFAVRITYCERIDRGASGKYEDFLSLLTTGP